jgi:hypothetical protein
MEREMQQQIEKLLEDIVTDYRNWQSNCVKARGKENYSNVQNEMYAEFKEQLGFREGSKYIKVTTKNGGSVWGFIVNTDNDKKFRKGDILKPAGYNAPARNAARGNILDGGYCIQWTGPLYL